jgi:hypothetical protein
MHTLIIGSLEGAQMGQRVLQLLSRRAFWIGAGIVAFLILLVTPLPMFLLSKLNELLLNMWPALLVLGLALAFIARGWKKLKGSSKSK